ncbi:MAG: hypothetical protein ACHQT9_03140 [Candidatus Saccharimonadales bacterium]
MSEYDLREQAANIFIDAAQYIRDYGWQVEGMGCDGEPRCSMGALASAYPKLEWNKELSRLMYLSLYKELQGMSLTQFNHRYRDGEKVAELYERVASKLQSKTFALV